MVVILDFGEDRSEFKAFNYRYSLDVCNSRELVLEPIDFPNAIPPTAPPRLSVSSLIHSTDHSAVYRATDSKQLFVVKFSLWSGTPANDLETETENYNKLSLLRGKIVPQFFGYYRTEKEERFRNDKSRAISCIILQDCDNSLQVAAWKDLEEEPTYAIFDLLAKFHLEGHAHPNDFEPRNVVERNGIYYIIDLHNLKPHECVFDGTFCAADGGPLLLLLCQDIEDLAWGANYWCQSEEQRKREAEEEDTWVWIHQSRFPEEFMPPQDVVDQILPSCITPTCPALRMFNGRLYDFFASVRKEHELHVAEDLDHSVDIPAEQVPYSAEEITEYKKCWKRCGLPTTKKETVEQAHYFRFKKDNLL